MGRPTPRQPATVQADSHRELVLSSIQRPPHPTLCYSRMWNQPRKRVSSTFTKLSEIVMEAIGHCQTLMGNFEFDERGFGRTLPLLLVCQLSCEICLMIPTRLAANTHAPISRIPCLDHNQNILLKLVRAAFQVHVKSPLTTKTSKSTPTALNATPSGESSSLDCLCHKIESPT